MTEDFLHYIWRYGLYHQDSLVTTDGQAVSIINHGQYNRDNGPDFNDARIKIGNALWIGHVEIHLKASDWFRHQHDQDRNYDQVILHVVETSDRDVFTTTGVRIPQLEIRFSAKYYDRFKKMVNHIAPIPCAENWNHVPGIQIEGAIVSLGIERMEERFHMMRKKLDQNKGSWNDLFLQVMFRAFGFGKNQENFDLLAQSIPEKVIVQHRSNLFQIESLLFGQAGLIPQFSQHPYPSALKTEYEYLSRKHKLKKDFRIKWKVHKTRPGNQPAFRIAQLASWLHDIPGVFDYVLKQGFSPRPAEFYTSVSTYWKHHYDFDKKREGGYDSLSKGSAKLIQINAVLPLYAFYADYHLNENAKTEWMEALEKLPSEKNAIMTLWEDSGFRIPNSFYSQAFLFIYRNYCVQKCCLQCRIGQQIIRV
jgi:hypothetical protein